MTPRKAEFALLLINFISASAYLATKLGVDGGSGSPAIFVAIRFLIASSVLALIFFNRLLNFDKQTWLYGSVSGAVCAGGLVLMTYSIKSVSSGSEAFLIATCSAFVPILDLVFYSEPIKPRAIFGIAVALAGVYVLTGASSSEMGPEALWAILAAVLFALHTVLCSRFTRLVSALDLGIVQIFTCATAAALIAPLIETPRLPGSPGSYWSLLYLGVVVTAFRFPVQIYAQSFMLPTRAGVIFLLEPVLASFYGWIFAAEQFSPVQLVGCVMILFGAWGSERSWDGELELVKTGEACSN